MVNKRSFLTVMLATTLAWSSSAAFATNRTATRSATSTRIATHASLELGGSMAAPIPFGNRLLNAYRILRGLGGVILPDRGTGFHTDGIQDGPDPVGGVKGHGFPTDGPAPANTPVR